MNAARILVVEDELIVSMDIQMRLAGLGYQVAGTTSDGAEAITLAGDLRPDLVLMDVRLGGEMDGIEAAEQIHGRFGAPVVFLTAYSEDHTVERAKSAHPFGYLLKPFEDRELKTTVEIALYKHRAEGLLRDRNAELEAALARVKLLSGLLPICAGCKQIRDDKGYWSQVETYIQRHSEATFTHGLCPNCVQKYFPGVDAPQA